MKSHSALLVAVVVVLTIGLAGCGGHGGNVVPPPPAAPTFTSTPVTSATEGTAYTYQLAATDPAGGTVTFSLNGPAGASLSGNTITWTPTAEQSRVANAFTVTAKTSSGGSATQSWTVTPNGTVRVTWADHLWDESGETTAYSGALTRVTALVPQADGSYQTLQGTVGSDSVLSIPNVPGGYYWIATPRLLYWTSSSTFDLGSDIIYSALQSVPATYNATVNFNFTGLDATAGQSAVQFVGDWLTFAAAPWPGSTTLSSSLNLSSNIDLASVKTGYAMQFEPAAFGVNGGIVLGPSLKFTDLNLTNGGTSTVSGALQPSPAKSVNLNIKGGSWATLFEHVAPVSVTPTETPFGLSAQPYVTNALASPGGRRFALFFPNLQSGSLLIGLLPRTPTWADCRTSGAFTSQVTESYPVLLTDQDFGAVQYGDPFPAEWLRVFSICQTASVPVTVPGSSEVLNYVIQNGAMMAPPTGPLVPLLSPVQNPTINGADLFTATTADAGKVTLSWTKPATGAPYGYVVRVLALGTDPIAGTSALIEVGQLATAKTSMTVPKQVLTGGNTFWFAITALSDGRANMETAPNRSALPFAKADVISAAITITGATMPQ